MSDDIFRIEFPKYRELDLPCIPVEGKAPIPNGWTGFLGGMPSEQKQSEWIEKYPSKNIGLLLGMVLVAGEVLVAFDVDDDRLVPLVKRLLHLLFQLQLKSLGLNRAERRVVLSGKRGKKGATIFVRAPKSLKSTVIKGVGGLGNIDFLAAGRMTVMPPSIHPETGRPYEVIGVSLLEVDFADLPEITEHHIKLLKVTIGSEHAITIMSGKGTHDAGLALTAQLVSMGASDEEITAIFEGLLPEGYTGDSLKELAEWIRSACEKGFGDQAAAHESLTKAIVTLALSSGIELFHDGNGVAYTTLLQTATTVVHRVSSSTVKIWLRHLAYTALDKAVSPGTLLSVVGSLESFALFEGPARPIHNRIAGDETTVVIDHGLADGQVVVITPEGWDVKPYNSFRFVRGAGSEPLPIPQPDFELGWLQGFLGLDDDNFLLLLAFLINALKPTGPYFILLVEGEQGSGKSFFCEVIKRIIDPNRALRLRLPEKPHDLLIQAKEYRLLNFDNASGMKGEMSDALCSLATGGGMAVRKLYTDDELHVLTESRPFVINGISGYASRPDLMERAIPIKLSPMGEGQRKTEAELLADFQMLLPGVLGALYDAVSHALRVYDQIEPPRHLRMADAAKWISAAEGGLDVTPGTVIEAIASAQHEFVVDRVNDDPLVLGLRKVATPLPFVNYISELFVRLSESAANPAIQRALPQSPSHLSKQLDRMRPAMAKAGITVEFLEKDRGGRKVRVTVARDDPAA